MSSQRYRRNEDRIISERLFTREDIDEMGNRLEDVEEENMIEVLLQNPELP
jgi:hypothetical protein